MGNLYSFKINEQIHNEMKEKAKDEKVSTASLYIEGARNILNKKINGLDKFHNENIERAVLSSIIFEPNMIDDISLILKKDDFHKRFHSQLYQTFLDLSLKEMPIADDFIERELKKNRFWSAEEYLNVLSALPVSNIKKYVDDILEFSNKRKMSLLLTRSINELKENGEHQSSIIYKENILKLFEEIEEGKKNTIVTPTPIMEIREEEIEFFILDFLPIPQKAITIIGGAGGSAKSAIVLQSLMRIAVENPKLKIFGWMSEDLRGYTRSRFNHFRDVFFANVKDEAFKNLTIAGNDTIPFFLLETSNRGLNINDKFRQFKKDVKDFDLIVLDPLIAFFGGEENNNTHARAFMNELNEWIAKEEKTIILIHHSKKSNKESRNEANVRGAGAIVDASRVTYEIKSVNEEDYKTNYSRFTGRRFNISESDDENTIKDACMTHRRVMIAKDNLGVGMKLKDKCNADNVFFTKVWGEEINVVEIEYEDTINPDDIPNVEFDLNGI